MKGWYAKPPPGFLIAAKVPQVITHEKALRDCEDDLKQFLSAMDCLREKQRGKHRATAFALNGSDGAEPLLMKKQ